ncbi:hypothetical protein A5N15_11535 [Rothia kristinae]|uniref:Uncharacterized protein n=1 Tax=Rothia kristinae TaxID=37923 RepID=A0A199NXY9_9MICC|nr:hypothetical protein [Rothia kristinae]OAX51286.1 hypothetical protein AN277_0209580 [Rothia kristinae]OAX53601.1 hypothetical protein A5N15_11535 [Rothia kristinae]
MILAATSSPYQSGPHVLVVLCLFAIPFIIGTSNLVVAIWALAQLKGTQRRITELETQQGLDGQRATGRNGQNGQVQ